MARRLHTPFFQSAQCPRNCIGLYPSFTYIADRRTNTGDGVNGRSVQTSKVVRESVGDIESPPIGLSRRTVDEEHDAERDRVRDREADSNPYEPSPALIVRSFDQPAIKKEDRHFRASSAD